jgi:tellurite resistance protein
VPPLARFPAGLFGAPLGLAGLGLVLREAARDWPVPPLFAEFWVFVGAFAFCACVCAYAAKWVRQPGAAREELADPTRMCFVSALPVSGGLVAGGLAPYSIGAAHVLWWLSALLFVVLQVLGIARWLRGVELAQLHGGWMIMLLGGLVFPPSALALGNIEMARFMYGAAIIAAPFVVGMIFFRIVTGPPLPDALKPTCFILLVPGGLLYANYPSMSGEVPLYALAGTLYCGVMLLAGLLLFARNCARWPFGPPWWAFTFPLDAMAAGAVQHGRQHPGAGPEALAAILMALAVTAVTVVLVRTLTALARGKLWA